MPMIILLEAIAELFEPSQQAKRWTLNFEDPCFRFSRYHYRSIARLPREQRHLAETILRLNHALMSSIDVHVKPAFNEYVKGVTSPVTLMDDLFTGAIDKQTRVRANLLARIVSTVNN